MKRILFIIIFLFLIDFSLATTQDNKTMDYLDTDIYQADFSFSKTPILNEHFDLLFTLNPMTNLSDTRISISLPNSVILVSGDLEYRTNLINNEIFSKNISLKVIKEGQTKITFYIKSQGFRPKRYYLFINSTETEGKISDKPFVEEKIPLWQNATENKNDVEYNIKFSSLQNKFSTQSLATITGRFQYQEDDGNLKPIRFAPVKLYQEWNPIEKVSGFTDSGGYFSFNIDFTGSMDAHVSIWTESDTTKVTDGNILDISYGGQTQTRTIDFSNSNTWNLGSWYFYNISANWQAMDYAQDEYLWFKQKTGWNRPKIEIVWPTGTWPQFDPDKDEIQLPSKSIARWGRSTLLHEYGHSIMYKIYGNSLPYIPYSGSHAIWTENIGLNNGSIVPSTGGFALIEGWADFLEAAVDENSVNLLLVSPQGDLDGDGIPGTAELFYNNSKGSWEIKYHDVSDTRLRDVEYNEWWKGEDYDGSDNSGEIVEGAVASILWDIFDNTSSIDTGPPNTDDDNLSMGIVPIFEILKNDRPQNITDFWNHWFATNDGTPTNYNRLPELAKIYETNGIPKCYLADSDGDGYLAPPCGNDCNDNNAAVNPGATESCSNSIDDNCNGVINENCNCVPGQTRSCGTDVGECVSGTQTCSSSGQWGDCVGGVWPTGEGCPHDGKDNDCDGAVDENYCPGNECYDWHTDPTGEHANYIEDVWYGPYCADGQVWHIQDVDNDGYTEWYMLVGENYTVWAKCTAKAGNTVDDFKNYAGTISYGCYDGSCNQQTERTTVSKTFTTPTDRMSSPEMYCYVDSYGWGWAAWDLSRYWDDNGNGQKDPGEHEEFYMVLKCGVDTDCGGDEYCYKDGGITQWYCRKRCGDGICQPGENCPQDSQGSEVCDNVDNDCDGQIDEFLSRECGSDVGVCRKGTQTCSAGSWGSCAGEVAPQTETCDGLDNDCDNEVDESLQRQCGYNNVGICTFGVESCSYGSWINCNAVFPATEICNGLDDDCDNTVDNNLQALLCEIQIGVCANATKTCSSGQWQTCGATNYGPNYELNETKCDDMDNDCDGATDEGCPTCVIPTDGMNITTNTTLCAGEYNLSDGINIKADGVVLDCNNAVIRGNGFLYIPDYYNVGLEVSNVTNVVIRNCNIENYGIGIFSSSSDHLVIADSIVSLNGIGLLLMNSPSNYITDNRFLYNFFGVTISTYNFTSPSRHNIFSNNSITYSLLGIRSYSFGKDGYNNTIDTSNTINGRPVHYFFNIKNREIENLESGHFEVVYSNNITILNNFVADGDGMTLQWSTNSLVSKNNISTVIDGILVENSNNNTIEGNYIENVGEGGVLLSGSNNNIITNNTILTGSYPLWAYQTGIYFSGSSNNKITGNFVKHQSEHSIGLSNYRYGTTIHSGQYPCMESVLKVISTGTVLDGRVGLQSFNPVFPPKRFSGVMSVYSPNNSFTENNFTSADVGLWFLYDARGSVIKLNNLYNNTEHELYNDQPYNVSAMQNYWGTTNRDEIAAKIYDYYDNSSLGVVYFEPYLCRPFGIEPLSGDVNCDCTVNIIDLANVGRCFGLQPIDSCATADINSDGSINIIDLAAVGKNFGKSC